MLLVSRNFVLLSVVFGVLSGLITHSLIRPKTILSLQAPRAESAAVNKKTRSLPPKASYDPDEVRLIEQMSNTVKTSFSDDYKRGAKQFFGGDFSKMDDARRGALREAHYMRLESQLALLKKRFYEESSFEEKQKVFEKIERLRGRNLELLKLIHERGGELMSPGGTIDSPAGEVSVNPAVKSTRPPVPVPAKTFQ